MDRIARLETFARIGYLARGIVYILLGYLALTAAGNAGTGDVLQTIKDAPLGTILLALVGIGLAGYGVFRLYSGVIGLEATGTGARAAAQRIGHAASGAAHLLLAYAALKAALAGGSPDTGGGGGTAAAGTAAALPGGTLILYAIGIGFLLAAASQAKKAITAHFMARLDPAAPPATRTVGRIGYAARAVVFAIIGWQLLSQLLAGRPGAVGGIEQALASLRDTGWLFTLVAIGLILFGLFSLIMARYRAIRDENVIARLRARTI